MASCRTGNCSLYNEPEAYIPLYFSYAAYCEAPSLNDWNCKWCNKASGNFKIENVITTDYLQSFIGYDFKNNQIVISFRGTHNYHDWFKDLKYKQIPYPNVSDAYVHEGFYNAYTEIHNNGLIVSLHTLFSNYPHTTNVLITGHSMGGALAELCALDLMESAMVSDDIYINLYTFGCPRWANKHLAQHFNNLKNISNWRIVNKNDPIAIVPGQFLGSYGFQHTATQVLYTDIWNNDLKFMVCDGSGEDPNCGYSLWTEETNAHLWYLNVHENCIMDDDDQLYHKVASIGSGLQNNAANVANDANTHWKLCLMLLGVGFIGAIIYYLSMKLYQRRNGYTSIEVDAMEGATNKKKEKKNLMAASLLHRVTDSN